MSIHSKDGWKVGQDVWLHCTKDPEQIIFNNIEISYNGTKSGQIKINRTFISF